MRRIAIAVVMLLAVAAPALAAHPQKLTGAEIQALIRQDQGTVHMVDSAFEEFSPQEDACIVIRGEPRAHAAWRHAMKRLQEKAQKVSRSYAALEKEAEALADRAGAYDDAGDRQNLLDASDHLALTYSLRGAEADHLVAAYKDLADFSCSTADEARKAADLEDHAARVHVKAIAELRALKP